MHRNLYLSRGRRNRRVLLWALAMVIAAGASAAYVADRLAGPGSAAPKASAHVAAAVPVPEPLSNVTAHRHRPVTVMYRVADQGTPVCLVQIVIRKASGAVAEDLRLGRRPVGRRLRQRLTVDLKPGHYTWYVRATSPEGVSRASVQGCALTVLPALPALVPTAPAIAGALRWARQRADQVGVAVIDSHGTLHGYNDRRQFQSASLAKAMLLVAYLRRHPRPSAAMRLTLSTMIDESDDESADVVFDLVGNSGLLAVAKLAGMRDFDIGSSWIDTQMTAADQVRFFYRYESYLPASSVAFARSLLSDIEPLQRWGIPAAAGPSGWKVFFKGGWLDQSGRPNSIVTQAAWMERGRERWALAVLTAANPSSYYGLQTEKGVTGLLLGNEPTPTYLSIVHQGDAQASQ